MGGGDFLNLEALADGIAYMALAHAAHHAINFDGYFVHCILSFLVILS
jgi:hypothetical protein